MMKKLSIIIVSTVVFAIIQKQLYSGAEAVKISSDHNQSHEATVIEHQQHSVDQHSPDTYNSEDVPTLKLHNMDELIQAVTDSGEPIQQELYNRILSIQRQLLTQGPAHVHSDDLVWYLAIMKKTPSAHGELLSIIEELNKDPKKVQAYAKEIAKAIYNFDYIPTNHTATVKTMTLDDISAKQVDMLIAIAKSMIKNGNNAEGLTIINELINRRENGIQLAPETLKLVKSIITAREKNNGEIKLIVREMLDTAATNIDKRAKKALNITDFSELVEQAKTLGLDSQVYQSWYKTIDASAENLTGTIIKTMKPEDLVRLALIAPTIVKRSPKVGIALITNLLETEMLKAMKPAELISFAQITPPLIEHSQAIGIVLLEKLLDSNMITPENFIELMAIQKASINSITPQVFNALAANGKLTEILSFFTRISQLLGSENFSREQRSVLKKYVDDLLQTYLNIMKADNTLAKAIHVQTLKAMKTDDLMNMGQLTQVFMEQAPMMGIELLSQLIDASLVTPENFAQIMALQKASINSIKPETLLALMNANKIDNLVGLLTKIVRLESNPRFDAKQRESLERHVADLLESYITALQPAKNNQVIINKIKKSMDSFVENAKDGLSLTRSIKLLEAMQNFFTKKQQQEWLQVIASKAQELRKTTRTARPEDAINKLTSSLLMAEMANKAGLDKMAYTQWVMDIVNKILELHSIQALANSDISMEMMSNMQAAAKVLQSQAIFEVLSTLTLDDLGAYIKRIQVQQAGLMSAIDGTLLTQPAHSTSLAADKEILDAIYNKLIKNLEASYNIRQKAKQIINH